MYNPYMFQTPERGTRVSRHPLEAIDTVRMIRFKPLNGEPGCRDANLEGANLEGANRFKPLNGEPGCRDR